MSVKKNKQILRYPLSTIDKDTDYLSIGIYEYKSGGLEFDARNEAGVRDPKSKKESTIKNLQEGGADKSKLVKKIYLPIPTNIMDTNSVGWGEDSINNFAAYGVEKIIDAMNLENLKNVGNIGKDIVSDLYDNGADLRSMVNPFFASRAINLIPGVQTTFAGLMARNSGKIINPNKELLFNGVSLRSFSFTFDLAPREVNEAKEIKQIIHCLKKNMAPDNSASGTINLFLQTPNVFILNYKTGNKNHGFLNKFKVAALKNMSVNYSGSGSYMTYNDSDKTPVHVQMNLQFQELVPIYNSDYKSDEDNLENVGY